jgi:hypothetical protein
VRATVNSAMTTPDPASRPGLQHFTNREWYIEVFRHALEAPEGETLRVLAFHGVGGVGKTTLIDRLGHELDLARPPIPHARFDVENLASPIGASRDVPLRLRSDLEARFGLSFPRFDLALTVLLASEGGQPPPLIRVNENLNDVFQFATSLVSIPKDGLLNMADRLLRKHETAERLVRRIGGTEEVIHLRERVQRGDPTLIDELIDRFADDLVEALPPRPGRACRGVLFFDTFETLWKGSDAGRSVQARRLDAWLRQLALKVMNRGVLIVVAGRDELLWAEDDDGWTGAIETHLLGGLSRHDGQLYLSRRQVGPSPWASETPLQVAILDVSAGDADAKGEVCHHPFYLALCADIVENHRAGNAGADPPTSTFTSVPTDQVAQTLSDRFLRSLPKESWELWVKELSLTPSFDESTALDLNRERDHHLGRAAWKQLCRYAFLEPQPDGSFRMHKTMRDVLRAGLRDESDTPEVHAWFRDHWTDRDEPALAFFHRWSLAPEESLNQWLSDHEAAIEARRIATARTLLDDWSEISLDGFDRQSLGDLLWASTHSCIGCALWGTPIAPRASTLNAAIAHHDAALRVYTETDFPADWAMTQNNLGAAYRNLPTGDRGENLRRAIDCYESALRVRTESDFPADWAGTQNNLGIAYSDLPTGDRGENLRRAIDCYDAALRVHTESDFPADWATTQFNFGVAYRGLEQFPESVAAFERAERGYRSVNDSVQAEEAREEAEASRSRGDLPTES